MATRPRHDGTTRTRDTRVRWHLRALLVIVIVALVGCVSNRGNGDEGNGESVTEANAAPAVGSDPSEIDPDAWKPGADDVRALVVPYFEAGKPAEAVELVRASSWPEAVTALQAILADTTTPLAEAERQGLTFMLGMSQLELEQFAEAHDTLAPLAGDDDAPLAAYAAVLDAEARLGMGETDAAMERLPSDRTVALAARASAVEGRVLQARDDNAGAVGKLEGVVDKLGGQSQRHARLALGRALQATNDLEAAAVQYKRVVKAAPGSDEAALATSALDEITPKLPGEPPTIEVDPMVAARDLYERHRSEQAIEAFTKIADATSLEANAELWCEARYLIGKSYTKLRNHDEASKHYDAVADSCKTGTWRRDALYNGARAHWNADRNARAIEMFDALIKDYPESSLADDSYLYIARIQIDEGKLEDAEKTLRNQVEDYPTGDMAKDAHWLIFKALYTDEAKLEQAVAYAESVGVTANEDDLYSQGRLAYFSGRALERLGREDEARAAFEKVIKDHPLSYYAMLAFGRLNAASPDVAVGLADELRKRPYDPELDVIALQPAGIEQRPAFERGVELVRVGLGDWGRKELASLEATYAKGSAEAEQLRWTLAALYEAAGARNISHHMAAEEVTATPVYYTTNDARARWSLAYPRPWLGDVAEEASRNQLPAELVYSIMREESGFQPTIESWANARGLMQLMQPTAERMARRRGLPRPEPDDLFQPEVAIPLGAAYLGTLGELYNRHPFFIVAGYNGGEGNIDRWLGNAGDRELDLWVEEIPFGQTRHYVKRVMTTFWRYNWLYSTAPPVLGLDPAMTAAEAAGKT